MPSIEEEVDWFVDGEKAELFLSPGFIGGNLQGKPGMPQFACGAGPISIILQGIFLVHVLIHNESYTNQGHLTCVSFHP